MNGVFVHPSWMNRGACRGSGVNFFPHRSQSAAAARAVCARCPVQAACLDFALDGAEVGVWGGCTEKERDRILRERGRFPRRPWPPEHMVATG